MLFFANTHVVKDHIFDGIFRFDGTVKTAVWINSTIINPKELRQGEKARLGHVSNIPQHSGEKWITSQEFLRRLRLYEAIIIWKFMQELVRELRMLRKLKKQLKEGRQW